MNGGMVRWRTGRRGWWRHEGRGRGPRHRADLHGDEEFTGLGGGIVVLFFEAL